jgi:hypothetical protein
VPHLVRHYDMPLIARTQVRKDTLARLLTVSSMIESWSAICLFALPAAIGLVLVMCFCDAEPANLVLQDRTLQSESFGGSPFSSYTS